LQHERYDLVHVHSQEAGFTARWLARFGGIRTIFYTPQTVDIRQSQWQNLYALLECAIARTTSRIISVTQVDAQRMVSWGIPAEKLSVVPNGIDLSLFENLEDHDQSCRKLSLDPNRPVIMQVGRLNPQKDPEMFVHGAKIIVQACPQAQLVWIGEGSLNNLVKSEIRAVGLQNNIHLLGRIDQAYRFMAAADIVTLTSRWEGLPYSLLEAMACAKPVVSTAVNGCKELVIDGETGFLVDVGDACSWADRVNQLIANQQLAQAMGSAGRLRVETKYSLAEMISQIERAYLSELI
jgi:glycosyltransferase involved in cell wall biosynthesis